MRRLMTGYAVTFNRRYQRAGHLFQNRYKSVVCEEDTYLLELIRYIHLNPLRAGLVKDLKELDRYPWTGHSAILGKKKNPLIPCPSSKNRFTPLNCFEGAPKGIQLGPEKPEKYLAEKTIEDVLIHFGDTVREARRRYRQFVKEGVDQGSRPELQGGGLVRSAGGDKRALLGRKKEERELGDARILGSGEFVAEILEEFEKRYQKMHLKPPTLQDLTCKVARQIGLSLKVLLSGTRDRKVSRARAIISYLAAKKAGYTQTQIADHSNVPH